MVTMQSFIDQMSANFQKERAESQMTLGKLIERLKQLPSVMKIKGLGELDSYRGYYSDLAFEPDTESKIAKQLLSECESAIGEEFYGYKGGSFVMGTETPLWVATYGCCGLRLMSINDDGSIELAPEDD